MKAIEMLQQYWERLKGLFVYMQYCVGNDVHTPVCRDFWMWTVYGSVAVGLLIALALGKGLLKEQLELYLNRKRLEARKIVADSETMEQAKWIETSGSETELSQEELAESMREAIKKQAELRAASAKKDS